MKKDNNGASEALSRIQWITKSAQFTEHQWIQLGDALLAFDDLINKHQSAQEKIADLESRVEKSWQVHSEQFDRIMHLNKENTKLQEAVKVLRDGLEFYLKDGDISWSQRDDKIKEALFKADAILGQGDALPSLTMEINHGEFKIEGNPKIITNGCSVSLKNKGEK